MSAAPSHPRQTLHSHLPRAGFLWPEQANLLRQERHDGAVLAVLRDHGGVASLQAGARGSARRDVEQAFVAMFDMALALAGSVDEFGQALDWVADLRGRLPWGDYLDEDIFIGLFLELCRDRQAWHANPREPFNTEEHGPLAHAIDAFYSVVSGDWLGGEDELWQMTLPPVVEQAREVRDEPRRVGFDPAAAAPHTLGTGASSAAGEPHPQTHTALGGVQEEEENDDEDDDIKMGEGEEEGEVEEVRERLARTEIGEDEDVEMED